MKTPIRRALNSDSTLCECVTLRADNSNATTGRSSQPVKLDRSQRCAAIRVTA